MKKLLTLVILHKDDKVLLGMKKRGFGAGNWNGFGGKVEEGESIEAAAKRELQEESGLAASLLTKLGMLDFSWQSKPEDLQVHIFKASDFSGQLTESEEMKPQWFHVNEIPYEKMWADDKYWMPYFLQNKKFTGKFVFGEYNKIAEHKLREVN